MQFGLLEHLIVPCANVQRRAARRADAASMVSGGPPCVCRKRWACFLEDSSSAVCRCRWLLVGHAMFEAVSRCWCGRMGGGEADPQGSGPRSTEMGYVFILGVWRTISNIS
jgi:hypothetical protein